MGNFISHSLPERESRLYDDVQSLRNYLSLLRDELDFRLNNSDSEYDKTYFATVVKNSTGVSDKLTCAEKSGLCELESGWYYVKLHGNIYKLECKSSGFELDEEVRVCVPCGDMSRMYIDFKSGTAEFKEWVRPDEWLKPERLPEYITNDSAYTNHGEGAVIRILSRGAGGMKLYAYNQTGEEWSITCCNYSESGAYKTTLSPAAETQTTDIVFEGDGQRWTYICVDNPEYKFFATDGADGKAALEVLEVIVGNSISRRTPNSAIRFGYQSSAEHIVMPCCHYPANGYEYSKDLGYLCGCKCLEISKCDEVLNFSSSYLAAEVFRIPDNAVEFMKSGYQAFYSSTVRYIYGKNIERIGGRLVEGGSYNCLTKIEFPKLKEAYEGMCSDVSFLRSVGLDKMQLAEIPNNCFSNCRGLGSIENKSVQAVGAEAFYNCRSMKKVAFEGCTSIGRGAFENCYCLTEAYLPECVSIAGNAFRGCYSLRKVTVKTGCAVESGALPEYTKIIYV